MMHTTPPTIHMVPFYLGAAFTLMLAGALFVSAGTHTWLLAAFYPLVFGALATLVLRYRALFVSLEEVRDAQNRTLEKLARRSQEAAYQTLNAASLDELHNLKEESKPTAVYAVDLPTLEREHIETPRSVPRSALQTPRYPPPATEEVEEVNILDVQFPEDSKPLVRPPDAPTTRYDADDTVT